MGSDSLMELSLSLSLPLSCSRSRALTEKQCHATTQAAIPFGPTRQMQYVERSPPLGVGLLALDGFASVCAVFP